MDGRTDIGTSHYGSKASKMTYGGKGHAVTHPTCSAVLCSAVLHSALLWSATLHSALQCAAPLGGSFVSEKVVMYLQVHRVQFDTNSTHSASPLLPNHTQLMLLCIRHPPLPLPSNYCSCPTPTTHAGLCIWPCFHFTLHDSLG